MAMSIRTNVASLNAQKNLMGTESMLNSSLSKLSSGFRITKAGDDAAGLGISSNLTAQIASYNQAARNAGDGISLVQTAEGALNETNNILTRLRELAMQSASDGVGDTERDFIQSEVTQLVEELDRVANSAEFNGTALLNGGAGSLDFQVGIRATTNDVITVDLSGIDASTAGTGLTALAALDISDQADASTALADIDTAIETIATHRATLGAIGNRFNTVTATIRTASENLSAANSRIRDVDVAEETSAMSRAQVLMQAGVSVLAQANQMPQMAMKLLG
jgi:flagellin